MGERLARWRYKFANNHDAAYHHPSPPVVGDHVPAAFPLLSLTRDPSGDIQSPSTSASAIKRGTRLLIALLRTLLSLAFLLGTKCHLRTDCTLGERPRVDSRSRVLYAAVLVYWRLIIDHQLICFSLLAAG
jgi:hypothetical protein